MLYCPAMKHIPKPRRILISLCMTGSSGRKTMLGILRFANESCNWMVEFANDSTSILSAEKLKAGIDGFIGEANPETLARLRKNGIPSIILADVGNETPTRENPIRFMTDDDEQIGRMGADYFLSLGNFASLAFVPATANQTWSANRQAGFERRLVERKMTDRLRPSPKNDLEDWLRELPKPAAIMAAYDFRAKEIIDACTRMKIKIPQQVTVLGVDNDELVCNYTQPTLSSVRIDHCDVGYCAAKALSAMLTRKTKRPQPPIRHPAECVVERESTRPIPPITYLVEKIQNFIRSHAHEPITVSDVVRHANISRRLADLRLKEATGKTIHEALRDVRLGLVVGYLRKSRLPINKISRLSGFQNIQRLKYVFKARYGVSMREFRAQAADSKV